MGHRNNNVVINLDLRNPVVALSGAEISHSLLKELCAAIARVDTITSLDFSRNNLGDDSVEVLAELIAEKPQLVDLNLRSNAISDAGVSMLCRALARFGTCKRLVLSSNQVSDAGLTELSKFLVASDSMEELCLMDTPISLYGTLAFADALVHNESLLTLRLPHVLGHRVLREVDRLMRRNWLRRNQVDERRAAAATQRAVVEAHQSRLQEQWRVHQPMARPLPPASGFAVDEWADPDLAPTLMFLEILDRKRKLDRQARLREQRHRGDHGVSASSRLAGNANGGGGSSSISAAVTVMRTASSTSARASGTPRIDGWSSSVSRCPELPRVAASGVPRLPAIVAPRR